jgi:hypothetical protein
MLPVSQSHQIIAFMKSVPHCRRYGLLHQWAGRARDRCWSPDDQHRNTTNFVVEDFTNPYHSHGIGAGFAVYRQSKNKLFLIQGRLFGCNEFRGVDRDDRVTKYFVVDLVLIVETEIYRRIVFLVQDLDVRTRRYDSLCRIGMG